MAYRSPETFSGKYTTASEVYSFAIVLFELLSGVRPWHRDAQGKPYMDAQLLNLVVTKRKRPEMPSGGSIARTGPLPPLMRRCWTHEPKRRPAFEAIAAQLQQQLPHRSDLDQASQEQIAQAAHKAAEVQIAAGQTTPPSSSKLTRLRHLARSWLCSARICW